MINMYLNRDVIIFNYNCKYGRRILIIFIGLRWFLFVIFGLFLYIFVIL